MKAKSPHQAKSPSQSLQMQQCSFLSYMGPVWEDGRWTELDNSQCAKHGLIRWLHREIHQQKYTRNSLGINEIL